MTGEGPPCLVIVPDLIKRWIVDRSIKPRMTFDIASDALKMAWFWRKAENLGRKQIDVFRVKYQRRSCPVPAITARH